MAVKSPIKWLADFLDGFNFVEVMIVIAIVGILAAVAIPGYQDWKAKQDGRPTSKELREQQRGQPIQPPRDHSKTC